VERPGGPAGEGVGVGKKKPPGFVPAKAFFVAVVKQVNFTEKGGEELIKIALEIPVQEWVKKVDLVDVRGQLATIQLETIRLDDTEDMDLATGVLPGRPTQ